MSDHKINNTMFDADHAWGDADYYYCDDVTVVIYKRRSDCKPCRMTIEKKDNVKPSSAWGDARTTVTME